MGYQADDDQLVNAVFLELQIEIGVGEATGTPVLRRDNLAWLGFEPGPDLTTPRAVFEALARPGCFLDGRNILPGLVVAGVIPPMQRIETRSPAARAAFSTCSIFGTQWFASATPLMRSQILPPSGMKSLYGSTTRSAVISSSYVCPVMPEPPPWRSNQQFDLLRGAKRLKTRSRALMGAWQRKQELCTAQPPVEAYFLESLTVN
jgi:hypothetical protein